MEAAVKEQVKLLLQDKVVCPANIDELNKVISLKNKLTKQLNNIYNKIESINNIINPIEQLIPPSKTGITIAQTTIDVISFIPSTAVTPIPVGPILLAQKGIRILRNIIGRGEGVIGEGLASLRFLLEKLQLILDLLEIVDILIESCAGTLPEGELLEQEQISEELLASTVEQAEQLSPVTTNINGFNLSVIPVSGAEVGNLKRRRAIAKNPSGVVMLKGEPSFSSNDQVLIDELVFYIQQNNLKAD
jgi:hypothetical protein